jgi:hypothetical protein
VWQDIRILGVKRWSVASKREEGRPGPTQGCRAHVEDDDDVNTSINEMVSKIIILIKCTQSFTTFLLSE